MSERPHQIIVECLTARVHQYIIVTRSMLFQLKLNTKAKTLVVETLNRFGVGLSLVIVLHYSDHWYR